MFRCFLFMKGYYLILLEGFGAERFINLCKVKSIYLWDMKLSHNTYRMKISVQDYNKIDEILNKTGVKVDIQKKYGLPFLLNKKNRNLYFVFAFIAILIIFIGNLFVWQIKFEGNQSVTEEQLSDFLKTYDVTEGVMKINIPFSLIEEELRKEFSNIKWCSVALKGNTLSVKIEENTITKNENNQTIDMKYSDIVAMEEGVVTKVLVRNGLSLVNVGDFVKKDQILVTGEVPIYDDGLQIIKYHYYDADADVWIETSLEYENYLEKVYFEKEYTGRMKKIHYLKIKNRDLHLPVTSDYAYYDIYTESKQVKLLKKLTLPVYYGTYKVREYYLVEKEYTDEEVLKIFNKNLSNYYASLSEKGVQILEKDVKIEQDIYNWVIRGKFVLNFYNSKKEYKDQPAENIIQ